MEKEKAPKNRTLTVSENEIKLRLERSESTWNDFIESNDLHKRIIINNSSLFDYHRQINNLVEKYSIENEKPNFLFVLRV
ncbi:MAG: hypothetical protein LBU18_04825 [Treponema sp.]|jgi:hypothetical protein|nr:hypothetical protein [Treponema sp.]